MQDEPALGQAFRQYHRAQPADQGASDGVSDILSQGTTLFSAASCCCVCMAIPGEEPGCLPIYCGYEQLLRQASEPGKAVKLTVALLAVKSMMMDLTAKSATVSFTAFPGSLACLSSCS